MIDFEVQFRKVVREIKSHGEEYAHAKATSWHLQELRKVILATEINRIESGTAAKKDALARTTEAYQVHLKGTQEAIEREHMARAHYETAKAEFEALRSLCSREKKAMEIFEHESEGEEK